MAAEKQMAVNLLYTFDSESQQFIAKPNTPVKVTVYPEFNIGFCQLDQCLGHLMSIRADLVANDYTVFTVDCSEDNEPLMSHGRLSSLTNTLATVTGKVKTNMFKREIFEVRIHFKRCEDRFETRRLMPPSSPPQVKRYNTLPTLTTGGISSSSSDDELQLKPEFVSNSFNQLEGPMRRATFNPRKRALESLPAPASKSSRAKSKSPNKVKVPRCHNCHTFTSATWRWSANDEVLCNACGLWPRSHDGMPRPASHWAKKKEKKPEEWRVRPLDSLRKGDTPYATYELTPKEYEEALRLNDKMNDAEPAAASNVGKNAHEVIDEATPVGPSSPVEHPSTPVERPSTPVQAMRQETLPDKENIPPERMTPNRPLPIMGTESHHKWMARFIHNNEGDIFDSFMHSPSKQALRPLELDIQSSLSSSPPSSSTNFYDVSEQDLASIGADWIFRSPEKDVNSLRTS